MTAEKKPPERRLGRTVNPVTAPRDSGAARPDSDSESSYSLSASEGGGDCTRSRDSWLPKTLVHGQRLCCDPLADSPPAPKGGSEKGDPIMMSPRGHRGQYYVTSKPLKSKPFSDPPVGFLLWGAVISDGNRRLGNASRLVKRNICSTWSE